jgi:hypothetical protein
VRDLGTLIARWTYAASSLLGTAVFWFYSGTRWTRGEFPVFDDIPLLYDILPFAAVGLALAASRRPGLAAPVLEVVASLLWFLTFGAFALWLPWWSTVERLGAHCIDALAVLVGFTALSMGALAIQALGSRAGRSASLPARLLQAAGAGLLGLYLAHASLLLYAATRTTLSGGVAAMSYEVRLRVLVSAIVVATLATSAVAARLTRAARAA